VSDLVPEGIRGTYFGLRTAICGLVGVIGVTLASAFADGFAGDAATEAERLDAFLVLVAASLLFSGGSWVLLLAQPVRRMRRRVTAGWRAIWEGLADRGGRRILVSWCLLAFSTGITTGIYLMFFLDRLKMGMTGVAVYAWIALAVSTLMTPALGRFADRFGHRNLLLLAWGGVFWQPLLSVLTPDDMPHLLGMMPVTILIDAFAGGCFWPAVGLAQTNLVIAQASSERRAGLFASLSALTGVIGFLAAILGGLVAEGIGDRVLFSLGGVPVGDLRFPMLLGTVLRAIAGLTIFRITEPPRAEASLVGGQGFTLVWRLLIGKPVRPVER
jgi:MFS family permease